METQKTDGKTSKEMEQEVKFEDITLNDCERYEGVRTSGATNMFAVDTVCRLSGLSRQKVIAIMESYGRLNDKFNFRVDEQEEAEDEAEDEEEIAEETCKVCGDAVLEADLMDGKCMDCFESGSEEEEKQNDK